MFPRESVKDLRQIIATQTDYPPIVFVVQGSVEEGKAFFEGLWPEARAISDPDFQLYKAFGIKRGNLAQIFGPSALVCGLRAAAKGNFVGKPMGDPRMMPGAFVVNQKGKVLWHHEFQNVGDHPDFSKIPEFLAK